MAALFEPFPLWLSEWETSSLANVPLVSRHKSRVVHASAAAKALGIKAGSSLATALGKVPELEVTGSESPYLTASWERLVEELSGLTRTLETPSLGRLLMDLEPADAAQLAETYRVRVGMAESVEVATLAALVSSPGKVRDGSRRTPRHAAGRTAALRPQRGRAQSAGARRSGLVRSETGSGSCVRGARRKQRPTWGVRARA